MRNIEPIYVVGYPRSGNTWLSRILGEVLDSPVEGYKNAKPIASEGKDRTGKYVIRQLHLKPVEYEVEDGLTANELYVHSWSGDRIVTITRDPRDVAVSVMYYWDLPDIETAVTAVGKGVFPLTGVGPWAKFVGAWRTAKIQHSQTFYENLHWRGSLEIKHLLQSLGISLEEDDIIETALKNQEINTKREIVKRDGDKRPYGKEVQVKHLRKGSVGDWRQHFTRRAGELAQMYFGDELISLGYAAHEYWYLEDI